MQKLTLLSLLAILPCACLYAQAPDYRFGKVSLDELRMERYDKDPDADAVILYEDNYIHYQITTTVSVVTEYRARIKVLKPDGADQADVSIGYVDRPSGRETVTGIDAAAYNLVDGKIVKTPLKRQYVFTEEVSQYGRLMKFSIPEVREGTVIEYRYRKTSPNITYIPSFVFQHDIPVAHSHMEASIPDFFSFNLETKGYVQVDVQRNTSPGSIGTGPDRFTFNNNEIKIECDDVPALKREPFVWCLDDFRSMISFELAQIALPFSTIQNYATSWKAVNEALKKSDFDTHTRINNPFKEEVAAIRARESDIGAKAHAVLRLVQSKMKWNGSYRLFSNGPRAAANKGEGSSADINFVLMAALKDAGFEAVPVLLSPRHLGRLSLAHPTIDGINAFVVRISDGEGNYAYLDGTDPASDLNLLPVRLLVDRARIYGVNGEEGWCDLTSLTRNTVNINMILKLALDGTVTGNVMEQYANQSAMNVSREYAGAKSKEDYIESMETEDAIQVEELDVQGVGTAQVSKSYAMTRQLDATDDFVYVNATVIPFMSTNELNAQSRTLPIEFTLPVTYDIRCSLELPEGYTIEETPKSIKMTACENGLACQYVSKQAGRYLQFSFRFQQPRIIFLPREFPDVNMFYGMVADLSNSQFVIRKNAPES